MSDEFKAKQKKEWDSVAAAWKKWWSQFETGGQTISADLVEASGIKEGSRVLDIATGIGEPALTAAKKVGESGKVVATDQAPQMIEIAKERAKEEGVSNVDFRVSDGEDLKLDGDKFDAVKRAVKQFEKNGKLQFPGLTNRITAS